jgi:phosphate transport system substrate-binding protein
MGVLLAGCRGGGSSVPGVTSTTPDEVSLVGLTVETYPVVDGSTSALPLQQMVACYIFKIECQWGSGLLFDINTRAILPPMDAAGDPAAIEYLFNLSHTGTHDAYMNLIRGDAELILVARQPSQDEYRSAHWRGVELDYRPVALDAFVFLVNVANPVESLEVDRIRDIYTGRVTNWDQLGVGIDLEGDSSIHTYRRNPNSGSQELMEALVMQGEEMIDSPDLLLDSMVGPFNAIGHDMLGIGYSVYYYAAYMLPTPTVRLVPVAGVLPTAKMIADKSYPFVTEVYVVVRADALANGRTIQLRNWLLTPEGQAVVAQSGYVPADGE